ncbi:hypothetical protein [Komagataeibacter nataicola]|uniref:hypothetical protein n=1 Tax=Komagataeibacter nataicola TaxID=265960 RepID=UPI00197C347A|nr:hypothetical protein [Komagataeibacter nataicola]
MVHCGVTSSAMGGLGADITAPARQVKDPAGASRRNPAPRHRPMRAGLLRAMIVSAAPRR